MDLTWLVMAGQSPHSCSQHLWCRPQVRPAGGQQASCYDQLASATAVAEANHGGIYARVSGEGAPPLTADLAHVQARR